jgi:hypothetical protein
MGTPPLSKELALEAQAAVEVHGSQAAAARAMGISRSTLRGRLEGLNRKPNPAPEEKAPETIRRETRDATFWRGRANAAEKELAAAEHLAEQLAGVRDTPVQIPDWLLNTTALSGNRGRSVIGALTSDVHMGEEIDAEEILGINKYNPDICRARMNRYFEAVCTVGPRWSSDTVCEGALLAMAGDLISGDIHDELRMTNSLTAHEQVSAVVGVYAAGLKMMLEVYPRVHVVGVPGNHGRTTHKPTAKLYARLSYDILAVSMLAERFRDDPRVTFQFGRSKDQITPVFGRTVFTTHFDKIGTRGGMGFAGPMLPIVRGTKKISEQQASIGRRPDLIQGGHYHTSGNPGNVFANGSVPGYAEFADDIRAVVEPPQQWLYLLHSRWWLRERASIQLEEPGVIDKPKVRIPAGWRETADA